MEEGLSRLAMRQLPSLLPHRLGYLLLSFPPSVQLSPQDALSGLSALTGLKGLTLQAQGCDWAGREAELGQLLSGLPALRSLHVAAGRARALGAAVLPSLPYLPA
jgi:hypothetical protein